MNIKRLLISLGFYRVEDMAKISKRMSGLPMNIFVDENERGTKHWHRIKFQPNTQDRTFNSDTDYYTMSISDNPEVKKKSWMKNELSSKDIDLLRRWVVANKDLLFRLASSDPIDIIEFTELSVKASDL